MHVREKIKYFIDVLAALVSVLGPGFTSLVMPLGKRSMHVPPFDDLPSRRFWACIRRVLMEGGRTVRDGYDPGFLGGRVDAPASPVGARLLAYTHFTVCLNPSRRLCWWAAWNIDGLRLHPGQGKLARDHDFFPDDRVPEEEQALNDVYHRNRFDRGHIARRADLLWGSLAEAIAANRDSFCYTNIAPQMDNFNQPGRAGELDQPAAGKPAESWGLLENSVLAFEGLDDRRVSVVGGPVLDDQDPPFYGLLIPRSFWKVIFYRVEGRLAWKAFVLSQKITDPGRRSVNYLEEFKTYEVSLDDLERRTGLTFGQEPARQVRPIDPVVPVQILDASMIAWTS